jgi:hypothetical protein
VATDKTANVMVRLTPEVYEELKDRAIDAERSIAQEVRLAIRLYLEKTPA